MKYKLFIIYPETVNKSQMVQVFRKRFGTGLKESLYTVNAALNGTVPLFESDDLHKVQRLGVALRPYCTTRLDSEVDQVDARTAIYQYVKYEAQQWYNSLDEKSKLFVRILNQGPAARLRGTK